MSREFARTSLAMLGVIALTACSQRAAVPDGTTIFDEQVALTREISRDVARRELKVEGAAILVAIVDENLTDVRVGLGGFDADDNALPAVAVENHQAGAGVEIALLDVSGDARVGVTLAGPQDSELPGTVRLRVLQFGAAAARDPEFATRLAGYRAWTAATDAGFRFNSIRAKGPEAIGRAISSFSAQPGDAALAAHARLVRAHMLNYFAIDPAEARAEAQRAATAFAELEPADVHQVARARLVEARALADLALDPRSVNPSTAEAQVEARRILAGLSAEDSPFGPVERARAIETLAVIERTPALFDDSDAHYREAKQLFQSAGYVAGVIEMSAELANNLNERGLFRDAAEAFEQILPDIHRISNPRKRVTALVAAAHADGYAERTDRAAEHLLQAMHDAREFGLRELEGSAAQSLGFNYQARGDHLQAKAFLDRALQITREDNDMMGLSFTLQSSGALARAAGDYATAIQMHEEAVSISVNPIARMRALLQLGQDYWAIENYPEAIRYMRASLAVELQDPRHFAFNDVKRNLAEVLIEHGDGSRATLAEAGAILRDALQQCIQVRDRAREIAARRVLAQLLVKQGKLAAARAEYDRTLAMIFEYRGTSANPELRASTLPQEQATFRGYFDLMMRDVVARGPVPARRASNDEEATLRMLERAREARFGALRTGPMDAATSARIDGLLERMANNSLSTAKLLHRELTAAERADLAKLQLEMSELRAELDRERTAAATKLASREKADGETRNWRNAAPGVVQVSYALGNDHAYVWIRTAGELRTAALAATPASIEKELADLASLDRQKSPAQVEQSLAHMSKILLPAGLLPADSAAVEIVAEGRISGVPFSGLNSPTDRSRRLVETHAITMTTSMLEVEQAPRGQHARPFRLVALASGSGTLRSARAVDPAPRLQAAIAEIAAVGDLFEAQDASAQIKLLAGDEGNATALRAIWSSGADVVHFATHALADLRQPLASLLVLPANGPGGAPTYLTAGQVETWRGDADLVFLSACDSAIGPPRFAAGMPGLQSAFLRAGARGVIATLWPIEDVMAREFTADFYRRFTRGESALQALSATQRSWLQPVPGMPEAEQVRRRITALAHGYYRQ